METLTELPIPAIFALAVGLMVLVGGMLSRMKWVMLGVAALLFVASLGLAQNYWGSVQALWLYPVQVNRSAIFLTLGCLLTLSMAGHLGRISFFPLPIQGATLLTMAICAGFLRMFHESPVDGGLSLLFAFFTILPLLVLIPAALQEWDDWVVLIRMLAFAHLVWIGGVVIQFLQNPSLLTVGQAYRFIGFTSNPQHAGTYLSIAATLALWLFMNDDRKSLRALWVGMTGITVILLGWTGSRTGMGMLVLGTTAVLYSRVGRSILYLPFAALALAAMYALAGALGIDLGLERLTSTENTRASAWSGLFLSGMRNPVFGTGVTEAGDSENSYLLAFAAYGLGMVVLLLVLVLASVKVGLRLLRIRGSLDPLPRSIVDLTLGFNAMFFGGAVFEGYIMARVAAILVFMLIFSAMTLALFRKAEQEAWLDEYADEDEAFQPAGAWDEDDDYGHEGYGEFEGA